MACPVLLTVSNRLTMLSLQCYMPRDFISCVQTWTSSCISSGATSLRDHDSSHRGLGGAIGSVLFPTLDPDRDPSLDLKTFLKKGMLSGAGSLWRTRMEE